MKRDMDLIRKLAVTLEESDSVGEIDGYAPEQIDYHLWLLEDAGLVTYQEFFPKEGSVLRVSLRLTWQGHEFLDVARNSSFWEKAKQLVLTKTGALSFEVLKEVLMHIAKEAVAASAS